MQELFEEIAKLPPHLVLLFFMILVLFIVSIRVILGAGSRKRGLEGGSVMTSRKESRFDIRTIAYIGVMAALVYVATVPRIPFLGSKVHFANAFCLLAGMLLGPVPGGIAAGLGSAIYDYFTGYDTAGILITFVSKFAMAWVCAVLMKKLRWSFKNPAKTLASCIAGSLTYVILYMLKTYVYQRWVYLYPLDAVGATMISKLIPSLINALFAVIAAPLLFHALYPALRAIGVTAVSGVSEEK